MRRSAQSRRTIGVMYPIPKGMIWSTFGRKWSGRKRLERVNENLRGSGKPGIHPNDFDSVALGVLEGKRDLISSASVTLSVLAVMFASAAFVISMIEFNESDSSSSANLMIALAVGVLLIITVVCISAVWVNRQKNVIANAIAARILMDRMQRDSQCEIKLTCTYCETSWRYCGDDSETASRYRGLIRELTRKLN